MTGNFADGEIDAGKRDGVAGLDGLIGRWAHNRQAKRSAEVRLRIRQEVLLMDANYNGGLGKGAFEVGVAADVVGVAVGVEQHGGREAVFLEEIEDQFGLEAGVDDQRIGTSLA